LGAICLSYGRLAQFKSGARYVENFPKSMADVYRASGTEQTITDHRVEASYGGGICPEQHWGILTDGRSFYYRMRHGSASLCLGPVGSDPGKDLPAVNPDWVRADFDAAYDAGKEYPHSFFLGPRPYLEVYPDDPLVGWFETDEDRQDTFTKLLNEIDGPVSYSTGP